MKKIYDDIMGWKAELIYMPGSCCDKCDFDPDENTMYCPGGSIGGGLNQPGSACRHYDAETDSIIGGYLKKLGKAEGTK